MLPVHIYLLPDPPPNTFGNYVWLSTLLQLNLLFPLQLLFFFSSYLSFYSAPLIWRLLFRHTPHELLLTAWCRFCGLAMGPG